MPRLSTQFAVLAVVLSAAAQDGLQFEVASLKPAAGGRGGVRTAPGGERVTAANATLKVLIMTAYRVRFDQVAGGPAWIGTEHFDLNAKAARPSTAEQLRVMLQRLLTERFDLQFHRATREGPIYALTADPEGAKLTPAGGTETVMQPTQNPMLHMKWQARAVSSTSRGLSVRRSTGRLSTARG